MVAVGARREVLAKAVYRSELDALMDEAAHPISGHPTLNALREWMDRYARLVATKHACTTPCASR